MVENNGETAPMPDTPIRRAAAIIGIGLLLCILTAVVVFGAQVLLLVFAGVLLSIFLGGLSDVAMRYLHLPRGLALACVCLLLATILGLGIYLLMPSITEQIAELSRTLPQSVQHLRERMEQTGWGRRVIGWMPQSAAPSSSLGMVATAAGVLSNTLNVFVNIIVIVFVALYVSAQPTWYREGMVTLIPPRYRARGREILSEMSHELRWWLIGQIFAMVFICALITTGLFIIGIPMALTLGLMAGLLNFVPNFGPVVASIPAILLALTDKPVTAAWVVMLYVSVQALETYVVTPMIQQHNINLPPALTISFQVLMALLIGVAGVALATPLVVVLLVLVKMLYVEDLLGDKVALPGQVAHGNGAKH
jgi:predicted PurR-regulated permease PerM